MEYQKIRFISRPRIYKYEGDGNAYRYEFTASDNNAYTISMFEEKVFPDFVATEMLADNANLQLVSRA